MILLVAPFLLIQPIFIIWVIYKLIKFIAKLIDSKNTTFETEKEPWLFLLFGTSIIAPIIGFNINATEIYQQGPDSWGGDDNFRIFNNQHLLEMAIFYFTTIGIVGICLRFFKHQVQTSVFTNGLLIALVFLSFITSIQLGQIGFLLSGIPVIGLILISPVINVFLFSALFIYHIKTSVLKNESVANNLLLGFGIALFYITIFQLILSVFGFDDLGLIKAFTESRDGFIPKIIK
ncbi:MAG: hypothetical protein ACOYMA_03470 [Bacteroidia bacterium]